MCSHNEMDTHGTATISAMDTNIHVHGLQDRHGANLCPSKTICTPLFVVARHCHQSISVDCFPVHEQTTIHISLKKAGLDVTDSCPLNMTHFVQYPSCARVTRKSEAAIHVSCTKSKGQENMYFGKGHLQLREPIQIGGA